MTRWFIGHDCSGHQYLIPEAREAEWGAFCEIPEDDERSWEVPDWAVRIDGGQLTFCFPYIGMKPVEERT
jgi:hypothetical protein